MTNREYNRLHRMKKRQKRRIARQEQRVVCYSSSVERAAFNRIFQEEKI